MEVVFVKILYVVDSSTVNVPTYSIETYYLTSGGERDTAMIAIDR